MALNQCASDVVKVSIFPGQFPTHFRQTSKEQEQLQELSITTEGEKCSQGQVLTKEVVTIAFDPQTIFQRLEEMQINSNPSSPQIVDAEQGTETIRMQQQEMATTRLITEQSTEIKQENIQPVNEEKTPEALTKNAETSNIEIIVPKSEEDIIAEHDKKMANLKRPNLMSKYKFMKGGRTEITHRKFRTIFCSICQTQVPSLDKLAIHLDREHKIRVNEESAPRVVDADKCDEKKERDKISQVLQAVENTPRTVEPLSDSDEPSSSSSEDEAETEKNFPTDPQAAYIQEKTRGIRRLMLKENKWIGNLQKQLSDPEFSPKLRNSTQCHICYIEIPTNPKFRFAKRDHEKLHKDGLLLQCQYCNMSFNFEAELNQHLDGMRVPVVSEKISNAEMMDILYQEHHCPRTGCSKSFTSRKCLLFHRTGCTDNFKFHRCQICEKPFILHEDLKKHIQRSHNWEKRMIPCKVAGCDKTFATKRGWITHVSHVHKIDNQSTTLTEDKSTHPNLVKNNNGERYTYWNRIGRRTKPKLKNCVGVGNYYSERKTSTKMQSQSTGSHSQAAAQRAAIANLFKPNPKIVQPLKRKPIRQIFTPTPSTSKSLTKVSQSPKPIICTIRKSIPPSSKIRMLEISKHRSQNPRFPKVCSYCTRAFITEEFRNEHCERVHNVNLSLSKPFLCPVLDCDFATTLGQFLIRHLRRDHKPDVEIELLRKSLKEDKEIEEDNEDSVEIINKKDQNKESEANEQSKDEKKKRKTGIKCTFPFCPKTYSTKRDLKIHLNWHWVNAKLRPMEVTEIKMENEKIDFNEDNEYYYLEELDPNEEINCTEENEEDFNPEDKDPEPNLNYQIAQDSTKMKIKNPTTPSNNSKQEKRIPRPLNSFLLFTHDYRKQIRQQNLNIKNTGVKRIAELWKDLPTEQKAKYTAAAEKAKVEHMEKYPNYKFSTGSRKRKLEQTPLKIAKRSVTKSTGENLEEVEAKVKRLDNSEYQNTNTSIEEAINMLAMGNP